MVLTDYIGQVLWNTVLFLLIGVLPWIAIAWVIQFLSNSIRKSLAGILGIQGYVYLTFPGVMVHEIGHAVFCLIFRHKILEMKLFSPEEDGTLGYVNHAYNPKSFYQRIGNFFIGTGPIWFGITVLWFISLLLLPENMQTHNSADSIIETFFSVIFWKRWQSYVWLYLALTIASHITLSSPDLAGSADGGVAILMTVLIGFFLFGWYGDWESKMIEFLKSIFLSSCGIFSFVITMLLVFCITCKVLSSRK